jgi:hypothetical protein
LPGGFTSAEAPIGIIREAANTLMDKIDFDFFIVLFLLFYEEITQSPYQERK